MSHVGSGGSGGFHAVAMEEPDPCPSRPTMSTWLRDDCLKLWAEPSRVSPRAPDPNEGNARPKPVRGNAGRRAIENGDIVVCANEKTGVQALTHLVDNCPAAPGCGGPVENTDDREGTVGYQVVLNVTEGGVTGHVVDLNTGDNVESLGETVMTAEPYTTASQMVLIGDNGGTHHPKEVPAWREKTYGRDFSRRAEQPHEPSRNPCWGQA